MHYPENGFWFTTHTGAVVDLADPESTDVRIEDVAHALARICRFNGHTLGMYSVAQHSVHVAELVARQNPRLALDALLHDAHEIYVGDITRPMKAYLRSRMRPCAEDAYGCSNEWDRLESRFQERVAEVFGIQFPTPELVAEIDAKIVNAEASDQMPAQVWSRERPSVHGYFDLAHTWSEKLAEEKFLAAFRFYGGPARMAAAAANRNPEMRDLAGAAEYPR